MHDKVFIIDNKTVVTGSYNFTVKANKYNNENAIVVHNKEFASRYKDEFEGIFKLGL
jgi:phosphatidylserine/phosphatidylglycerophosphate/cardiolipin synthase-like enzyme